MGAFEALVFFESSTGSTGVDFAGSPGVGCFFGVTDSVSGASGLKLVAFATPAPELLSCTGGIPLVAVTLAIPLVVSPPLTELLLLLLLGAA